MARENLEVKVEGDFLTIRIDLRKRAGKSEKGGVVIARSGGWINEETSIGTVYVNNLTVGLRGSRDY